MSDMDNKTDNSDLTSENLLNAGFQELFWNGVVRAYHLIYGNSFSQRLEVRFNEYRGEENKARVYLVLGSAYRRLNRVTTLNDLLKLASLLGDANEDK